MKSGLEEFLKRIEAKPTNETLIDRFMTLVLEEDGIDRILYLKSLVGLLLKSNPYAALKAAYVELQEARKEKLSREYEIGALKDVESCFIDLGRTENAALVREEISKLQSESSLLQGAGPRPASPKPIQQSIGEPVEFPTLPGDDDGVNSIQTQAGPSTQVGRLPANTVMNDFSQGVNPGASGGSKAPSAVKPPENKPVPNFPSGEGWNPGGQTQVHREGLGQAPAMVQARAQATPVPSPVPVSTAFAFAQVPSAATVVPISAPAASPTPASLVMASGPSSPSPVFPVLAPAGQSPLGFDFIQAAQAAGQSSASSELQPPIGFVLAQAPNPSGKSPMPAVRRGPAPLGLAYDANQPDFGEQKSADPLPVENTGDSENPFPGDSTQANSALAQPTKLAAAGPIEGEPSFRTVDLDSEESDDAFAFSLEYTKRAPLPSQTNPNAAPANPAEAVKPKATTARGGRAIQTGFSLKDDIGENDFISVSTEIDEKFENQPFFQPDDDDEDVPAPERTMLISLEKLNESKEQINLANISSASVKNVDYPVNSGPNFEFIESGDEPDTLTDLPDAATALATIQAAADDFSKLMMDTAYDPRSALAGDSYIAGSSTGVDSVSGDAAAEQERTVFVPASFAAPQVQTVAAAPLYPAQDSRESLKYPAGAAQGHGPAASQNNPFAQPAPTASHPLNSASVTQAPNASGSMYAAGAPQPKTATAPTPPAGIHQAHTTAAPLYAVGDIFSQTPAAPLHPAAQQASNAASLQSQSNAAPFYAGASPQPSTAQHQQSPNAPIYPVGGEQGRSAPGAAQSQAAAVPPAQSLPLGAPAAKGQAAPAPQPSSQAFSIDANLPNVPLRTSVTATPFPVSAPTELTSRVESRAPAASPNVTVSSLPFSPSSPASTFAPAPQAISVPVSAPSFANSPVTQIAAPAVRNIPASAVGPSSDGFTFKGEAQGAPSSAVMPPKSIPSPKSRVESDLRKTADPSFDPSLGESPDDDDDIKYRYSNAESYRSASVEASSEITKDGSLPHTVLIQKWTQVQERLKLLSGLQIGRSHAIDFVKRLLNAKAETPTVQRTLTLLLQFVEAKLTRVHCERIASWLFEELDPQAMHQLWDSLNLKTEGRELYLDHVADLAKRHLHRRALSIMHDILRFELDLSWYRESYPHLVRAWDKLGLEGWIWLEEEGGSVFCDRLARREDPQLASLLV